MTLPGRHVARCSRGKDTIARMELLERLARARIGSTHNQYTGPGGDVRLENLAAYLAQRAGADIVAVGEAAGYQGARWSGIAFTSERDLARWGDPYRPTSARPEGWSEPSGTIVHAALGELQAEQRVVLWNVVPTHPHRPGQPLSNRRPTAGEIAEGAAYLDKLLALLEPRLVIAVGRVAEAALGTRASAVVRHPAHGGASLFRAGLGRLLSPVPPGAIRPG
jgi:uracil-DNA glycosylase